MTISMESMDFAVLACLWLVEDRSAVDWWLILIVD